MALLELQNITAGYDKNVILKDLDFQVEKGELVSLLGSSGCGKTTTLRLIAGFSTPMSGKFMFGGKDYTQVPLNKRNFGFVFQSFHLMPRESALENVSLPLSYAGVKKKERKERALKALGRVGLEDRATFMPTQLSGGQKQRVAIARAMVNNPKILLADEPTGALDSKSGAQIMELFQKLNEEGVTIVMITHDKKIADHAKQVYHIIDGEISREVGEEARHEEEKD